MASADPERWERLRSGDPMGLREVYAEHADAIFRFAFRRMAAVDAAEDVVQATFTSVWRQAAEGRLPALELGSARPLLLRIAMNECRNVVRSRRRREALHGRISHTTAQHHVPDHADAVSARVDAERRMAEVRAALRQLPTGQRDAVELVFWEELSLAEAAQVLGVAEGTVKSRVSRARKRLGELLSEAEEENR